MTENLDEEFMRQAINLARGQLGRTGSNPAVGCIVVRDGVVIAQAVTSDGGRPHAEEQALKFAGADAAGATAYVSLEPCGERTSGEASCAERLVAAGVARVLYSVANPDARSAGLGPGRLRAAEIPFEAGLLANEAADVYAEFLRRYQAGEGKESAPQRHEGHEEGREAD